MVSILGLGRELQGSVNHHQQTVLWVEWVVWHSMRSVRWHTHTVSPWLDDKFSAIGYYMWVTWQRLTSPSDPNTSHSRSSYLHLHLVKTKWMSNVLSTKRGQNLSMQSGSTWYACLLNYAPWNVICLSAYIMFGCPLSKRRVKENTYLIE